MTRPRVVIAGLGDTGVLTAVHLARHADVVGISDKPGLISGQELGLRISRPEVWARDYRITFDRFRGLDEVRIVHGSVVDLDPDARTVTVRCAHDNDAAPQGFDTEELNTEEFNTEHFDALVIATGVHNGFWRRPGLRSAVQVDDEIRSAHERFAAAETIAIIGGGAAAVSSAANLAATYPSTSVDLFFPGERALPRHHPRTWHTVEHRLRRLRVGLHPGHRAVTPPGSAGDEITGGAVRWSTGQPPTYADAVLWAIGRVRPNTSWLPPALLDDDGFVRVTPELRVPGTVGIYAVGDVAATDELRSSARNRADRLLAHNIRAYLSGRPGRARSFVPPRRRWGSVLGAQADGLQVFTPRGHAVRFPAWSVDTVLQPWIVRRAIYGGVRRGGGR